MASRILIIERGKGRSRHRIYTYMETPETFALVTADTSSDGRKLDNRVNINVFDWNCCTVESLRPGQWTSCVVEA